MNKVLSWENSIYWCYVKFFRNSSASKHLTKSVGIYSNNFTTIVRRFWRGEFYHSEIKQNFIFMQIFIPEGGQKSLQSIPAPPHTKCYYDNCKLKHLKARRLKWSKSLIHSVIKTVGYYYYFHFREVVFKTWVEGVWTINFEYLFHSNLISWN